ncbi:hypothetical protein [Luteibacter sp. Lutesp34]|uniref:hypothetical protein n=1 Tax=Luteibacter sp. Lutesp34 TaxID=3243030 RepID=UPI0039B622D5
MLSMIFILLGATGAAPGQDVQPAPAATTASTVTTASGEQSVDGGKPQRMNPSSPRTTRDKERWTDGMNTKRAPDPRKRDEYGAPKVTPPRGQGTDNPGGIPREHD